MREGSALLDRLEKRFDKIDSRADRRSRGMKERDSFLGHFSSRMKELESMVQVPEMSAFRRLPKVGSRFDPWGNMGGWSVIKDLTYLEWLNEQDFEEEEVEAPRVSAWGTASGRGDRTGSDRGSAWLNTPYTPARVAGKPAPKPRSSSALNRRKTKIKRVRSGGLNSQQRRKSQALAPTMRVSSPLQRAMGRAAVASARNSQQSRVMGSLPPTLSKTVGAKWIKEQGAGKKSGRSLVKQQLSTARRSPMFRLIDEELTQDLSDGQVSQTTIAKGRTGSGGVKPLSNESNRLTQQTSLEQSLYQKRQNLASKQRRSSNRKSRGLQSLANTSEMVSAGLSSNAVSGLGRQVTNSTSISSGMAPALQRVVRKQLLQTVDKVVPSTVQRVQKSVRSRVSNGLKGVDSIQKALKTPSVVVTEVVDVIQRTVLKQAEQEIQKVFSSANIQSLEGLAEQTGTIAKAIQRVERVVKEVTEELVQQNEAVIETAVESVMTSDTTMSEGVQPQPMADKNVQQVIKRLRSKGVSQQLAERMATSLPPTETGVRQAVGRVVEQLMTQDVIRKEGQKGLGIGSSNSAFGFSQSDMTTEVRAQLEPIFSRLKDTGRTTVGETFIDSVGPSILPTVAGERFEDRIVADVVNEISKYAKRETIIEGSVGQRQLMNSLEKSVGRLVSKTRTMNLATGSTDWVDVRAFGQELDDSLDGIDGVNGSTENKPSPWFTREADASASDSSAGKKIVSTQVSKVLRLVAQNPTRLEDIARQTGVKVSEVQDIVRNMQTVPLNKLAEQSGLTVSEIQKVVQKVQQSKTARGSGSSLSPIQQAAARVLKMVDGNPTRPEVIARQTGLKVSEVQGIVRNIQGQSPQSPSVQGSRVLSEGTQFSQRRVSLLQRAESVQSRDVSESTSTLGEHPLEKMWERATSPIALPEWTGMGTSAFKPMLGESAKGWRLSPKRRAMHPYAVNVDSTVLQNSPSLDDVEAESDGVGSKSSPWFSKREDSQSGFGFVPQSISGDAKLSTNEIAMFGQAKSVQLSVGDIKGQQARWLEPNRTAVLDDGTVIHAKVAKRLGLAVKSASKQSLPLSWTLEGLQLQSDHKSLPNWAKRASGKPQVKASPEFLVALAKTSSAEEVAEVILQNSGRSQDGILPRTAMTAIDQIRREAHRTLTDMQVSQDQNVARPNSVGRARRRRVSRTAYAVSDGLTGLKPMSTAAPAMSGEAQNADKVSRLARQLESLVSMAESNRRDEAREGVRMAEESHDAIAEGQALSKGEERDYAVDIEALRQEVMSAFEQEMSLRSLRSFDNSQNTDPWW